MTEKQFGMLYEWYHSKARHLSDVYGTWSSAKQRGYDYCNGRRYTMQGFDARIPYANGWQFSYAFLYHVVNDETGVIETWMEYHTAHTRYNFFITDDSDYMETIHDFFEER